MSSIWTLFLWLGLQGSLAMASVSTGNDPPPGPGPDAGGIQIQNPLGCGEWVRCLQTVMNGIIALATPIAAIAILVGGFQLMASGGNEEKVRQGKKTIIYAVVGYAIILLATAVVAVIQNTLSGDIEPRR